MKYRLLTAGFLSLAMNITGNNLIGQIASLSPSILQRLQLASDSNFSIHSLEIAGIGLSSNRMYVYQRLGEPQQIEAEYWECCGNVHKLHYDKTTVQLIDNVSPEGYLVFSVVTSDPDLVTRDGVRVGDDQ
ncbi:MAG: hypothetical protein ACFBSF_03705 [Leptolyngbyaceae cyanobacterium]